MDADLIIALLYLFVFGLPFVLVMRILWHVGSWFKRKDRHNDREV
jgi:hypothetical protein